MESKQTNLKRRHAKWQRLLMLAIVAVSSTVAMAQSKVQGKVVDATGEPVIGASVVVKGSSTGTVTDLDGNFTLNNVPGDSKLEVSYIGFRAFYHDAGTYDRLASSVNNLAGHLALCHSTECTGRHNGSEEHTPHSTVRVLQISSFLFLHLLS